MAGTNVAGYPQLVFLEFVPICPLMCWRETCALCVAVRFSYFVKSWGCHPLKVTLKNTLKTIDHEAAPPVSIDMVNNDDEEI